jgi:hypothetical protein
MAIVIDAHMLMRQSINSFTLRDVSLTYFDVFVYVKLAFHSFFLVFRHLKNSINC